MREGYWVTLLVKLGVVACAGQYPGAFERRQAHADAGIAHARTAAAAGPVVLRRASRRAWRRAWWRSSYQAVDLGLEGSLLAGILGGYVTGLVSGILISLPAMINGELLTMPLLAGIGLLGGMLRDCAPDPEEIWRFTPFSTSTSTASSANSWTTAARPFTCSCWPPSSSPNSSARSLGSFARAGCFSSTRPEDNPHPLAIIAIYATTLFAVSLPLKIWNNTRNESKLEEQQRLLMQARLQALTSQINPHFLFNTLNSVSSLIRTDPAQARTMVLKLSNILRRLLRKHDNFCRAAGRAELHRRLSLHRSGPLRRQAALRKRSGAETLDMLVPSMLLQPLVENCIKHGLSRRWRAAPSGCGAHRVDSRLHCDGGGRRGGDSGSETGHPAGAGHRRQQRERAAESPVRERLPDVDRQPARPRHAHSDRGARTAHGAWRRCHEDGRPCPRRKRF